MKGIIYYSSNRIKEPIRVGVLRELEKSGLPITKNTTVVGTVGALSMFHQILDCLERAKEKYVFFCEHDVLYHQSHFDFTPPRDDTYYYNTNVWRWAYGRDGEGRKIVTYDNLVSVSGLCVNRELARDFYKNRLKIIYNNGWDALPTFGNPQWARELGYEPGKKNTYEERPKSEEWRSEYPNIDIRHTRSMTIPHLETKEFVHQPTNWKEDIIDNIPGWDKPWTLVT